MSRDIYRSEEESDDRFELSRRRTLAAMGVAGFAGLASTAGSASAVGNDGGKAIADINVLPNPNFITNAQGGTPPFDDDTLLFDPGPVSIPLNEIIEEDDEYDSALFKSLNDGKHQVVQPPEGYDGKKGYDEPWKPVTWGEYEEVSGKATVGKAKPNGNGDTGTQVDIDVKNGIPNGQYTIWVVKFAALSEDSDLGPEDPFVTDRGNGLVGFHNLGQKFGDDGDSENDFMADKNGKGGIQVTNEGRELTGIPGYNAPGYPFVGEADDYEQDEDRLKRIANDLREEDEIHLVGAYHYDDQTWGVYPGPWHVNHFSAVFPFGE